MPKFKIPKRKKTASTSKTTMGQGGPSKNFSYQQGMRRGGENAKSSQFVGKDATQRYAQRYGEDAAQERFGKRVEDEFATLSKQESSNQRNINKTQKTVEEELRNVQQQEHEDLQHLSQEMNQQSAQPIQHDDTARKAQAQQEEQQRKYAQRQEEQQEQQKEFEQKKAELEQQRQQAVQDVHQKLEKTLARLDSGPHGIAKFYTSIGAFILYFLFDTVLGFIPVAGSLIAFFIALVYWMPGFLLGGDFLGYIRAVLYLVVELIFSLIGDAFTWAFDLGELIDAIPEASSLIGGALQKKGKKVPFLLNIILPGITFFTHNQPHNLLEASYERKKEKRKKRAKDKAAKKIKQINEATTDTIAKLRDKISKGKYFGGGIQADEKKMFTLLLMFIILLFGPLTLIFGIGLPLLNFSSIWLLVLFALAILILGLTSVISIKHMWGLYLFMGVNIALTYVLSGTIQLFDTFLGSFSGVLAPLLIVLEILLFGPLLELFSSRISLTIGVLLIVILALPYAISYAGSDRFDIAVEKSQATAQAKQENINFKERLVDWWNEQRHMGSNEYVPGGETEKTAEFIGVTLEDAQPLRSSVVEGQDVRIDIDFSANAYGEIEIMPLCYIEDKNIYGTVEQKYVQVSSSKTARVTCVFENLPKGYYYPSIVALYDFTSYSRIPLKFMNDEFANVLSLQQQYDGDAPTPQEYVHGDDDSVITSSGPITIAASTGSKDGRNILQAPLLVSRESPNTYAPRLKIQLNDFKDASQRGGVERVTGAQFKVPQGILLTNCDFTDTSPLPYRQGDGVWVIDIEDDFSQWETYTTLSCDIEFDTSYLDWFTPQSPEPWSGHEIQFVVDYFYKIEHTVEEGVHVQ